MQLQDCPPKSCNQATHILQHWEGLPIHSECHGTRDQQVGFPKYRTHVCGVIRMLCTKHLLQQSAVGRRWRSACGTVGEQNDNRQTNPACERHSRNLKTVHGAFKLWDATADGLASWFRAMTCCWQRQKLPHLLRRPSSKREFALG
jgi:hypothetical protein